jgi:hypothetical protein
MRGENIEELWYGFWLIKAVASLSFLFVVVLLCKRFLRCIPGIVLSGVQPNTRWCIRSAPCDLLGTSMLRSPKLSISAAAKGRGTTDERCDRLICPLDVKDRERCTFPA